MCQVYQGVVLSCFVSAPPPTISFEESSVLVVEGDSVMVCAVVSFGTVTQSFFVFVTIQPLRKKRVISTIDTATGEYPPIINLTMSACVASVQSLYNIHMCSVTVVCAGYDTHILLFTWHNSHAHSPT